MKAIDAHAHIFRTLAGFGAEGELRAIGGGRGRWATGREEKIIPDGYGDTDFTAQSLLRMMDENGIGSAMLLQGGFLGFENDYLADVRREYPDRFQVAATFDPYCRKADAILSHQIGDQGFRYFKFEMSTGCGIMGSHPAFRLSSTSITSPHRRHRLSVWPPFAPLCGAELLSRLWDARCHGEDGRARAALQRSRESAAGAGF